MRLKNLPPPRDSVSLTSKLRTVVSRLGKCGLSFLCAIGTGRCFVFVASNTRVRYRSNLEPGPCHHIDYHFFRSASSTAPSKYFEIRSPNCWVSGRAFITIVKHLPILWARFDVEMSSAARWAKSFSFSFSYQSRHGGSLKFSIARLSFSARNFCVKLLKSVLASEISRSWPWSSSFVPLQLPPKVIADCRDPWQRNQRCLSLILIHFTVHHEETKQNL